MINKKKNTVKNILLTGTIVAGSVLGINSLNASSVDTFKYSELGSGGELRAELLENSVTDIRAIELSCGEKTTDTKSKDAKCGEEHKKAAKTDTKSKDAKCGEEHKKATTKDSKSKDAKCGEKATDGKKSKDAKKKKDKDGDGDGISNN